ncbi:MAG: acylphosphatase [Acidimicrobiia bacterium]|nr:acylphosphatase [Acidimicrobiia bacterium]
MRAIHAYVSGTVQGVFFRQSCRRVARELGLIGWVRNTPDGLVEVWAQGEGSAIESLNDWLWSGPSSSVVSGVVSHDSDPDASLQDFLIVN